jgi:hypothetical protein
MRYRLIVQSSSQIFVPYYSSGREHLAHQCFCDDGQNLVSHLSLLVRSREQEINRSASGCLAYPMGDESPNETLNLGGGDNS